jgi:phosphoribosyl-AMP cyclohydrolase
MTPEGAEAVIRHADSHVDAIGPADLTYNADGLISVIAQQYDSREVLMLAWMDAEALRRTLTSGAATYFSRSRQQYWVKGETSGHHQRVVEVRYDCDRDCLLLLVDQTGPACHTGTRSCFTGRVMTGAKERTAE